MLKSFTLIRSSGVLNFTSNVGTFGRRLTNSMNVSHGHNPGSKKPITFRPYSNEINGIPAGHATQKPTPFQQKILVWAKMYPSVDKVPDRVSRGQMKKAMDIFRVRSSICMAALVFVFAAIMAMIGRKQRHDGLSVTKIALEKRQQ